MTSRSRAISGLLALLAMAYLAYQPGLSGGFLFDDFVNLDVIGATGPVDNWPTFFRYVTSGTADPTGRPLALLSFLVDARDWPADPGPFLRSNLILHMLNGALLFALLRALAFWLDPQDRRADAAALLGAGLWLLHPLFVSTTLYIVQREAMLPATFVLLGLLCYVRGRGLVARGNHRAGAAWMLLGIVGGTCLALLCKGNGVLLPLLAWVLEATILQHAPATTRSEAPWSRRFRGLLLALPSLGVLLYVCSFLPSWNAWLPHRDWTVGQRMLTEPRVLVDYLNLLVVPRSISTGLYNDGYPVSTGLLQPLATLPCLLLVLLLSAAAWHFRRRHPALSAGLLFYFSGHLLESSAIPLELYFEHRNYLPAMLLFWPLARGICALPVGVRWRGAIGVAALLLFAVTTFQRATLWGQPRQLAELWARQNPASSRAQATVAMMDTSGGRPDLALTRLQPLWLERPNDLQIAFNYVNAACAYRGISTQETRALAHALQHADTGVRLITGWLGKAIDVAALHECPGLSLDVAEYWLAAAMRNPRLNDPRDRGEEVEPLLAQLAIRRQQPAAALRHFDLALIAFTTPDVAARQASELARNGYYRQALAHLDTYERLKSGIRPLGPGMRHLHAMVLREQGYWPHEMAVLRAKLRGEIAKAAADNPSLAPEALPQESAN
jgi:hypothetical protein